MRDHNQRVLANEHWNNPPEPSGDLMADDTLLYSPVDIAKAWGLYSAGMSKKRTEAQVRRTIFKYTECGAWIAYKPDRVMVGSIVEGVEETTPTLSLAYPFTLNALNTALDQIEGWAEEIWMATHGCFSCGEEDFITGYIPVNPDCPECRGRGVVI